MLRRKASSSGGACIGFYSSYTCRRRHMAERNKEIGDKDPPGTPPGSSSSNALGQFWKTSITAGLASSIAVTLMAPVERAKLILQVQRFAPVGQRKHYTNLRDVIKTVTKEDGVFALWRGNLASVIRSFSYQGMNFAFKNHYKMLLQRHFGDKSMTTTGIVLINLMAGGFAGTTTLSIVYPLDFARTRMACSYASGKSQETMMGNIIHTLRTRGLTGLYAGFSFATYGVFVYRSIYFGLYDTQQFFISPFYNNLLVNFAQAELAAIVASLTAYPWDTVRRTMIAQTLKPTGSPLTYATSTACMWSIYTQHGLKGFYYGGAVNVLRSSGSAVVLVVYEVFNDFLWGRTTHQNQNDGDPRQESLDLNCMSHSGRSIASLYVDPPDEDPNDPISKYKVDRRRTGTGIF